MSVRIGNIIEAIGVGIGGDPSTTPVPFIASIWMDSNGITKGTSNSANTNRILEHGVDTDFASVILNAKIADTGAAAPTNVAGGAFGTLFGPAPLRSHASSGVAQRFGTEITFGKQLYAIDSRFGYVTTCAITSAELASHWSPAAAFPSSGTNFYGLERDRLKALEISLGRIVKVIYTDLGANDSVATGPANAMQVNMGVIVNQWHIDFPQAVVIWPLLSLNTVTTFVATVRTQMRAYSATAPSYFFMPNVDYATMPDISHWDDASCLTIGTQIAEAVREVMGISPVSVTTSPDIVGYGVTKFGNNSSLVADAYKGSQDRDYEILIGHSGVGTATGVPLMSDPAGWTKIIDRVTTAGIINAAFKVWIRQVPVGEIATDTVANSHDRSPPQATVTFTLGIENMLKRFTVRGPNASATLALDSSNSSILNVNSTGPHTIPTTTNSANALAVYIHGGMTFTANPTVTVFTAAGLTGVVKVTEFSTNMPDGDSGLLSIWKGFKAAAGSVGTASVTYNVNVLSMANVIVFKP